MQELKGPEAGASLQAGMCSQPGKGPQQKKLVLWQGRGRAQGFFTGCDGHTALWMPKNHQAAL